MKPCRQPNSAAAFGDLAAVQVPLFSICFLPCEHRRTTIVGQLNRALSRGAAARLRWPTMFVATATWTGINGAEPTPPRHGTQDWAGRVVQSMSGAARRAFMPSTNRGTALEAESEVPYPSCPSALAPQLKTAPPSTSAAVCLFAAATAKARCRSVVTLPHTHWFPSAGAGVTLNFPECDQGRSLFICEMAFQ